MFMYTKNIYFYSCILCKVHNYIQIIIYTHTYIHAEREMYISLPENTNTFTDNFTMDQSSHSSSLYRSSTF